MNDGLINFGIYLSYALVAIAALAAFVFPVIYMIQNPAEAKKGLVGVVALVVVLLLGYVFAGSEIPDALAKACKNFDVDPSKFKKIGAGINAFYILAFLAVVSLVASEIRSAFK